jgi:hypothetical protein
MSSLLLLFRHSPLHRQPIGSLESIFGLPKSLKIQAQDTLPLFPSLSRSSCVEEENPAFVSWRRVRKLSNFSEDDDIWNVRSKGSSSTTFWVLHKDYLSFLKKLFLELQRHKNIHKYIRRSIIKKTEHN